MTDIQEEKIIGQDEYNALEEHRKRGTKLFPVDFSLFNCVAPGSILHYHWHIEWQWMLMIRGNGVFVINSKRYQIKAGEAIFVNSGELHSGFTTNKEGCSHLCIIFHKEAVYGGFDIVQEYFEDFKTGRYIPHTYYPGSEPGEAEIIRALQDILEAYQIKYLGSEIIIKARLFSILADILRYNLYEKRLPRTLPQNFRKMDHLHAAVEFIHQNYKSKLTLQQIATNAGISIPSLCRMFKDMSGTTVTDYINTYRVYISTDLLTKTSLPINVIAKKCGFGDTSYYIKTFSIES
jgi:AraC-like DNA-binding protein/mannose-6-phosphate isomerase-like protein (cupin superfamily)